MPGRPSYIVGRTSLTSFPLQSTCSAEDSPLVTRQLSLEPYMAATLITHSMTQQKLTQDYPLPGFLPSGFSASWIPAKWILRLMDSPSGFTAPGFPKWILRILGSWLLTAPPPRLVLDSSIAIIAA
jgi:hypothetical protein